MYKQNTQIILLQLTSQLLEINNKLVLTIKLKLKGINHSLILFSICICFTFSNTQLNIHIFHF